MRGATADIFRRSRRYGNFDPRTPCGVRHKQQLLSHNKIIFRSTHPMRGATTRINHNISRISISIHAPHAGCDSIPTVCPIRTGHFDPRTPCGVRPYPAQHSPAPMQISIHAPHAGCDQANTRTSPSRSNFDPRTPCGVRLLCRKPVR